MGEAGRLERTIAVPGIHSTPKEAATEGRHGQIELCRIPTDEKRERKRLEREARREAKKAEEEPVSDEPKAD